MYRATDKHQRGSSDRQNIEPQTLPGFSAAGRGSTYSIAMYLAVLGLPATLLTGKGCTRGSFSVCKISDNAVANADGAIIALHAESSVEYTWKSLGTRQFISNSNLLLLTACFLKPGDHCTAMATTDLDLWTLLAWPSIAVGRLVAWARRLYGRWRQSPERINVVMDCGTGDSGGQQTGLTTWNSVVKLWADVADDITRLECGEFEEYPCFFFHARDTDATCLPVNFSDGLLLKQHTFKMPFRPGPTLFLSSVEAFTILGFLIWKIAAEADHPVQAFTEYPDEPKGRTSRSPPKLVPCVSPAMIDSERERPTPNLALPSTDPAATLDASPSTDPEATLDAEILELASMPADPNPRRYPRRRGGPAPRRSHPQLRCTWSHREGRWASRALGNLGFVYQLGHRGDTCQMPSSARIMAVIADNGIHNVPFRACHCPGHPAEVAQYLAAQWFPAKGNPVTRCVTYSVLGICSQLGLVEGGVV
ncbi:hypothetical protein DFH06DRAFT_1123314 [Mycena polygramma]|nr:hypothetical protein DFH06DRAFT_1123314 [Mycena polygramma]